jgi:diadenylate cyclase
MTLSKELGTRHRAGVGISEVSDSTTIIVSEETGDVSVAKGGKLDRNVDMDSLTQLLNAETAIALKTSGFDILKGMIKSDKQNKKDSDN